MKRLVDAISVQVFIVKLCGGAILPLESRCNRKLSAN